MTSLYDLGNATQSLVDDVTMLLEQGADPNSDEVQSLLKQMVESEDNWDKKAINVAKYLQHIQQQKEIIKLESDRLAKQIRALDSQYSNLHDLLLYQMQGFGKTEIKDPILSIKVRDNPPSVIVEDESLVPEEYKREKVTITVDKTAVKKAGVPVAGTNIVNSQRLEFK